MGFWSISAAFIQHIQLLYIVEIFGVYWYTTCIQPFISLRTPVNQPSSLALWFSNLYFNTWLAYKCIQTYTIQFRTFQRLATCPQPIVLFLKAQTKWRLTRWRNFGVDMTRKQCGIEAKVHGTHSERQHAPKKKTCKNQ